MFDPRPDYARQRPRPVHVTDGLEIADGVSCLRLRTNVPVPHLEGGQPIRIDQPYYFVLSYGKPSDIDSVASMQRALNLTIAGWRAWAKTCALPSFADTHVLRSALCLKLHAFADTGAIIAAATTSVPEALGTQRTWDYRYCWLRDAAFDLGARLARRHGEATLAAEWDAWADAHRDEILKRAYNENLGRHPDDLGDTTNAFSVCSFWWAEALAMIGELDEAVALFNRLLTYANPVGLFSEDIDPPTGRLLGNFPQAYTHVGVIHAAITIGELLEARDAKFRAWT